MPLITDTRALEQFSGRLRAADYVTVDTEFMREKTYWPILCLVQLAGPDEARAVDALAPGIELEPLFDLLADESVLKVFHAARQDLEIFHHLSGALPTPVFDTQVAAMVCGFGDSVGYETLVAKLAGARIDKSSRFTDWTLRPLSERQITYALGDVTHLRPAYEKLARKLHGNGRESWLAEEMAVLNRPATYDGAPREAWRRIKTRSADPRMLAVLRELAAWREEEAQRRDLPRNRVLRDEALVEIAHHTPADAAALVRTRGLGAKLAKGPQGAKILEAVKRGLDVPEADRPAPPPKPRLPRGLGPVVDLLKVLLKMRTEDSGVAGKLLASAADLELIAAFGEDADVPALKGWRRDVFGEDALRLKRGEVSLAVKGKKLRLVPKGGAGTPE
ncbi:MAG: ribonuclease D [Rhodospirillales bacterium]